MVLTKEELIASLQNEVRILLHLASKVDPTMLDYRPTPKQRSTVELLRYLSIMGPQLIRSIKAGAFDRAAWGAADTASKEMNFEQVVATIQKESDDYAQFLGPWSDDDFRGKIEMFGGTASRGSLLVAFVVAGHAAYRTQLFCYLKANGHDDLNTMNLWAGMDGSM